MDPSQHRYTDQEVALVLRRASELEERRQSGVGGKGLTLEELHDIAREVGFSPEIVAQAVSDVRSRARVGGWSPLGPPTMSKQVRALPGRLTTTELQRLISLVEESDVGTGTVTDALGSVRWTSVAMGHKFQATTQVVFSPADQETHVQVTQRHRPQLRGLVQLLPAAWGAMAGLAIAGSSGAAALPAAASIMGGLLVGGAIGRGVWHWIARATDRKVETLASDLVDAATRDRT